MSQASARKLLRESSARYDHVALAEDKLKAARHCATPTRTVLAHSIACIPNSNLVHQVFDEFTNLLHRIREAVTEVMSPALVAILLHVWPNTKWLRG